MLKSKFAQFLLILFFSGGTVLIGAHDLTRRYAPGASRARGGQSMIKVLHGETDMEAPRASMKRGSAPVGDNVDELDRKDRLELKRLLDQVAP